MRACCETSTTDWRCLCNSVSKEVPAGEGVLNAIASTAFADDDDDERTRPQTWIGTWKQRQQQVNDRSRDGEPKLAMPFPPPRPTHRALSAQFSLGTVVIASEQQQPL